MKKKARNEGRPGYKKTKVGWIPEDWECKYLSKAGCYIIDGDRGKEYPKQHEFEPEGHCLFLNAGNVTKGGFVFRERLFISQERDNKLRKGKLNRNDIVITTRGTVGNFALYDKEIEFDHVRINSGMAIIRSDNLVLRYNYLYTLLRSHVIENQIKRIVFGSAQPQLTISLINKFPIPLPPLPEQKKIAEILSAWDRAIEQVGRLINAKQRLKKGLMQQLPGRLRFPEFAGSEKGKVNSEKLKKGELPEGWKEIRAKKMFARRSVKKYGKETVLSVTQNIGIVPRNSLDRKINMTNSNTDTYKLVEPGDFVISLRSFQGGIEYSNHRGIVSPAYHVIRPAMKIANDFYKYFFKSYEFVGHLSIAVIGIRDGKQISYDDFAFMKFPYPPLAEQIRIAAVLSTCDRVIELLKKKQEKLKEQKKGLMQKLLTGEIRHPEFLKEGHP
ncbi:MAG: restriction endonuclease subunit S [Nitrospiraceae bacterium]|nr:restriction endonuclease subunit S [Nitrospiraceae bacterium]